MSLGKSIFLRFITLVVVFRCTQRRANNVFFSIRAVLDVFKPVMWGIAVQLPFYSIHRGYIKYENLPYLCYSCGRIEHTFGMCPNTATAVFRLQTHQEGFLILLYMLTPKTSQSWQTILWYLYPMAQISLQCRRHTSLQQAGSESR